LAERIDDRETLVHAMNSIGTAGYLVGDVDGRRALERSLHLCKEWGFVEQAGRAYHHLAWAGVRVDDYARGEADHHSPLAEALAIAAPTGELQPLLPAATASAEIAWLEGGAKAADVTRAATDHAMELAMRYRAIPALSELAAWRQRCGVHDPKPIESVGPY